MTDEPRPEDLPEEQAPEAAEHVHEEAVDADGAEAVVPASVPEAVVDDVEAAPEVGEPSSPPEGLEAADLDEAGLDSEVTVEPEAPAASTRWSTRKRLGVLATIAGVMTLAGIFGNKSQPEAPETPAGNDPAAAAAPDDNAEDPAETAKKRLITGGLLFTLPFQMEVMQPRTISMDDLDRAELEQLNKYLVQIDYAIERALEADENADVLGVTTDFMIENPEFFELFKRIQVDAPDGPGF